MLEYAGGASSCSASAFMSWSRPCSPLAPRPLELEAVGVGKLAVELVADAGLTASALSCAAICGTDAAVGGAGNDSCAAEEPAYCCARWAAAEELPAVAGAAADGRPNPAAAYRASMSSPIGGRIGVSGGGGDPRVARVVMTEAVESKRLSPVPVPGSSLLPLPVLVFPACCAGPEELDPGAFAAPPGGAKYCWWYSSGAFAAAACPYPATVGRFGSPAPKRALGGDPPTRSSG